MAVASTPNSAAVIELTISNASRADWDALKQTLKDLLTGKPSTLTGAQATGPAGRIIISVPSSVAGQSYTITLRNVSYAETTQGL